MAKITSVIDKKEPKVKPVTEPKAPPSEPVVVAPKKKRYYLLSKDDKVVATLIDRSLVDQWLAENKAGAVKFTEILPEYAKENV